MERSTDATRSTSEGALQETKVVPGRPKEAAPNIGVPRVADQREKRIEVRERRRVRAFHLKAPYLAARSVKKEAGHIVAGPEPEVEAIVVAGLAADRKIGARGGA